MTTWRSRIEIVLFVVGGLLGVFAIALVSQPHR